MSNSLIKYLPNRKAIERGCRMIQREWDEEEFIKRSGREQKRYTIPEVRTFNKLLKPKKVSE